VEFAGFDRRFIGRGMYLEELAGDTVRVRVAVDASGSISSAELGVFLSEVRGILSLYPGLEGELYFADSALYGPYEFSEEGMRRSRNIVRAVLSADGVGGRWERGVDLSHRRARDVSAGGACAGSAVGGFGGRPRERGVPVRNGREAGHGVKQEGEKRLDRLDRPQVLLRFTAHGVRLLWMQKGGNQYNNFRLRGCTLVALLTREDGSQDIVSKPDCSGNRLS
jgi:hypothetical protein